MRERVDQLGVAEPEIQRSGPDQIDVSLPDVKNADEAANQVGTTAQMYFYDWETNVLGANCKPAPADANVTGGSSAGTGRRGDRLLRRGHARRQVPRAQLPGPHDQRALLPRRHEDEEGPRRPGRDAPGPGAGGAEQGHQARPGPEGRRGQARHDRRPRAVAERQDEERPVLRPAGQAGAGRHGHQEPQADLRQRRRAAPASRSSPSTSRTRAARSGRRPRARSPSAAASRSSRATTRRPPSSTSRSCSTTS